MTEDFKCDGSTYTCRSLVGYSSKNATTLGHIQVLFSVKKLCSILEANSLPHSTSPGKLVNENQVVRIPVPCYCSNGTGVSNRVPIYTVKEGDSLFSIASDIFGDLVHKKIREVNSIPSTRGINIGQKLWIPLPCSCDKLAGQDVVHYAHVVKQGSSLAEVAAKFGTDVATLARLNGISVDEALNVDHPMDVPLRAHVIYKPCTISFKCNQTYLNYPFWTPGREECGHPDFKVNCTGEFAEFNISSVKFQVLEMNYVNITIRPARTRDYINDLYYNLCPQYPESILINQDVLPFSEDTVMSSFYYNCSDPKVDVPPSGYIRKIDCDTDTVGKTYFSLLPSHSEDRAILDVLSSSCTRNVSIPISQSALRIDERNQSLADIKQALITGFKVRFTSDCSQCVESGGACGHNPNSRAFFCHYRNGAHEDTCGSEQKIVHALLSRTGKIGIAFFCGFLGFIAVAVILGLRKKKTSHRPIYQNLKALQLKQYSYAEVKIVTKSFSHTVGKGGFGTVYKGKLQDGRKVAVKVLKDFKSSGEDFINEVASMSQTSHVNIVSLLGFCYEGSKRAIVYEFLKNGSLDQFLSKKKPLGLDVTTLYEIALGVARGLEYLHHGCKTRIVHFDIKPQNVLLDDKLCPKVSDFGLAKLCEKRESILSLLDTRGTIGYIAPEVFSRLYGRVSHKSDVYSYGMLVLEMIGARNKEIFENTASDASTAYFPDWIYKDLENGEHTWKFGDQITKEEEEIGKKMILVGLWCIQPCPSNRPQMNRVVEMMEGSLDALEVPPKPSMQISTTALSESSCLSEVKSNNSEELI
ncbi:unnamed protein product [Microthlaspi erraticum]|uniref:non-specific serine/threonine protein kinase n=1 Tax=Microthlaspi erraticum TaxID=1685480 RepID=A0A6D2KR61_9BRAS|nr:unnamed protein product [Microthlaspi erraticum]